MPKELSLFCNSPNIIGFRQGRVYDFHRAQFSKINGIIYENAGALMKSIWLTCINSSIKI